MKIVHKYIHMRAYQLRTYTHMHVYTYIYICIYACMYIYIHVYIYSNMQQIIKAHDTKIINE